MSRSGLIAATFVFVSAMPSLALSLEVPVHTGLVIDQAGILNSTSRERLEASLQQYQKQFGPQIQLFTIQSLEGQPIESYSIQVVNSWKLGDAKRDDGVLFLVALKDRQMRIEVGQGLEGQLPDVIAGRIINDVVKPYFKEGRYEAGVVAGLQEITARLGGTLSGVPAQENRVVSRRGKGFHIGFFPLFIFFFFILPLFRGRRRGNGLLTGILLGNLLGGGRRDSGWGGGSGGGGIFGGGSGGGFSGGGASGRW